MQKPTVNITQEERIQIASAALDTALGHELPIDDYIAPFYSQLSEFDILTNQTKYKDRVYGYFQGDPPQYENMPMRYYNLNGYAAVRAYTAYGNEEFLDFAVRAWEYEKNHTRSISGVPPSLQNSSVKELYDAYRQCNNSTNLVGGLISSKGEMVSSDNGRFWSLLAEITGNNTFLEASTESEEFILSQLYNDESLLRSGTSIDENNPCQLAPLEKIDPWNAGYAIAGLAIMSSINPANETIRQKLTNTILAATSFSAWHDGQGIMASADKAGNMDLISGLFTAHTRDSVASGWSSYLQGYLAVQYNAILDLATNNGTNIYGMAWIGPPPTKYSTQDQILTVHGLVAGIGINSTEDVPSPVLPAPTRKVFSVGGIVGAVLGGSLVLVGISAFIIRRKRHRVPVQELITPFGINVPERRRNHHWLSENPQIRTRVEPQQAPVQPQLTSRPSPTSNEMTTEELVRMLNQRLQPERWNNNEQPPSY